MAVVAVAVCEVEVPPAGPVDELALLRERVAGLTVENDGLSAEIARLVGEKERLRAWALAALWAWVRWSMGYAHARRPCAWHRCG